MDDKGWPGDLMGYCLKPMKGFVYILFVKKKERPILICGRGKNLAEREKPKCKSIQMTKRHDTRSPGRTFTLP